VLVVARNAFQALGSKSAIPTGRHVYGDTSIRY
jgi:hypothetical protein